MWRVSNKDFQRRVSIMVVGCGGTGGFVAEGLCRLFPDANTEIILVDYDRVEKHNLLRQNFFAADIGKFKSEALALRLASLYRRPVRYSVFPFDRRDAGHRLDPSADLVIGCVDNAKARQHLAVPGSYWWLDAGNGQYSGQVLLGNGHVESQFEGEFEADHELAHTLPAPHIQLPSLLIPAKDPTPQRDCAEAVAADEQSPVINQAIASLVLTFAHKLIAGNLNWMGAYLDLEAGTLATVPVDPATVSRIAKIPVKKLMAKEEKRR